LNPQRRTAYIWFGLTALFAVMFIIPLATDWIDMFNGGGALMSLGVIMGITSPIVGALYLKRASQFDQILSGQHTLARWKYDPRTWASYTEEEHVRDRKARWQLFAFIAAISLVVGLGFWIIGGLAGEKDTWIGMVAALGIIVIIAITAAGTTFAEYRRNKGRQQGEVVIADEGVVFNGVLHTWHSPGAALESVTREEGNPPVIVFAYSGPSGTARGTWYARVPVPHGREEEARRIIDHFNVVIPPKE
jgi:hypothetical protein